MTIILSLVHVFVCVFLILVILLQAGRGGGMSEMFGGAMSQNQKLFGTETNSLLTKVTSYCAIIFIITCISLDIATANRGRSLLSSQPLTPLFGTEPKVPSTATPAAEGTVTTPAASAAVPAESAATAAAATPPAAPAPAAPAAPASQTAQPAEAKPQGQ